MQQLQRFLVYNLLLILFLVACSEPKRQEKKAAIEMIAEKVSSVEIEHTISDLVAYETRFPYQKQLEVANYLSEMNSGVSIGRMWLQQFLGSYIPKRS